VADAGIAMKDNISLFRDRGYPYMVVERKRAETFYLDEFKGAEDSFEKTVKDDGTIYFKKIIDEDVVKLLILSAAKRQKEQAMDTLKEKRFLEDIGRLKKSVSRGSIMLLPKIQIRIGRLMQKYSTVAKYYDIGTKIDREGKKVLALTVEKRKKKEMRERFLPAAMR